ncbi:Conserved_hypothetical protein [Hexamita inflata]|uniref:EGF-like domain-containing protein n=1 Tax=Hexamita inflata TaxID=28002 RepID=A0ABP1HGS8_9EUKA
MNNVKVQNNIYMTQKQKNIQLFIQNNITQQSVIDVRVNDMEVNTFALFGLNTFSQTVRDSIVSITIDFQVVVGALICLTCDIEVFNSTLLFVGSGMQISGVIIQALDSFRLQQTFVQFRLSSLNSSGLVNLLIQSLSNFFIVDCKLAGSNLQDGPNNGYIASHVEANQTLNISTFKVCVDATPRFGNTSTVIDIIGGDSVECEICGGLKVVYGICLEDLQHGQLVNGALQCVDPFEFVDNRCVCAYGYLLNGSACVNILNAIQNMSSNIDSQQLQQIEDEISELANQINALNLSIHNSSNTFNTSQIEQYILGNYTNGDLHLQQNTTVLDWRIFNNISYVNGNMSTLNNNITEFKQTIKTLNEIIQQQNEVIIEFNCSKIPGYQMINGTCTQVNCTISGQQVIQGRCRCTDVNSYVSGTSCVCPFGSTLFSGVCICDNTHAYISGTSCVCPTYSSPIGNVCTCPANSQIVGTKCACNQIQGQTMLNTATPSCSCPANSVPDNGVCVCNVIAGQTLSNGACRCPIGKYVVNTSCVTIDIIDYNDSSVQCSQPIYIQTFDIIAITKSVSANNFTNGYVFSTTVNISNAFININDYIYGASTLPLFQNQSNFQNIKIQLGDQIVSGGQLLTNNRYIIISQMKIISKDGTIITANLGQFNILTQQADHSNITNFLLNLSFAMSLGSISLINTTNNVVLNITNYQILGNYQSQGCVSLTSQYLVYATIRLNNINFQPTMYIVGKQSSFFISVAYYSQAYFNNITIVVGNENNPLIANYVQSTSSNHYQYGGLLFNCSRSNISINSIIYDCFQIYQTSYVSYSGLLVGSSQFVESNITIFKMCLQQQLSSTTLQFKYFGLIGNNEGNVSIQQSSVTFIIQALNLNGFGLIGYLYSTPISSEILNLTTTINTLIISNNSFGQIGGIIGLSCIVNTLFVQHVIINNSNISSGNYTGGVIGNANGWYNYAKIAIYYFQNVSVQNSIISSSNISTGGIVGSLYNVNMHMSHSQIFNVIIQSNISYGLVFGIVQYYQSGRLEIDTSYSAGDNYINGVQQINCNNWLSSMTITGC